MTKRRTHKMLLVCITGGVVIAALHSSIACIEQHATMIPLFASFAGALREWDRRASEALASTIDGTYKLARTTGVA